MSKKGAKGDRYYWLRLKEDFFKSPEIKIIENMDNGKDYIIFLMKLKLESLELDGYIMAPGSLPLSEKILSTITDTDIDVVRSAIKLFSEMHLLEIINEQALFMKCVEGLIGSECDSAARVREHRACRKSLALQCNTDVTGCNREIEKEIEIYNNSNDVLEQVNNTIKSEYEKNADKLAYYLYDLIVKKLNPTSFKSKVRITTCKKWSEDIVKLLRIDGAEVLAVKAVIDFAISDNFWRTNIWSGYKLRKHFDRLYMQIKEKKSNYTEMKDI